MENNKVIRGAFRIGRAAEEREGREDHRFTKNSAEV